MIISTFTPSKNKYGARFDGLQTYNAISGRGWASQKLSIAIKIEHIDFVSICSLLCAAAMDPIELTGSLYNDPPNDPRALSF